MPTLVPPTAAVHASFLAAMDEYRAEGRGAVADTSNVGHDLRTYGPIWSSPAVFERFVAQVRAQADEDTPRPTSFVPTSTFWWVDGDIPSLVIPSLGVPVPSDLAVGDLALGGPTRGVPVPGEPVSGDPGPCTYLGRLAIRHRLAPGTIGQRNGHIGYDVRPSARRRGHATAMLAAALPLAAALGLTAVLITCDASNVASRRTIERNGGVSTTALDDKLRFWVPTI